MIEKKTNGIDQSLIADFLFYNLFFSPQQQKIYALFCRNYKNGTSNISFYQIDFPPLSKSEISQIQPVGKRNSSWIIAAGVLIIFLSYFLFIVLKRKKTRHSKKTINSKRIEKDSIDENNVIEVLSTTTEKTFDRTKQCISLLGGLNIIDKAGNNITANFTPILKNLLLLILLHSETEEKGINDKKIDNFLWSDKDSRAARNNRNVSLTRLKLLLEDIGDVTLLNNNGFWKITLGEEIFFDYHASLLRIKSFKSNEINNDSISGLLELLMYGELLPFTQTDWLDKFKSDYSNDVIDILYNLLTSKAVIIDKKLELQIADTIFLFDSLNEEALGIKCSILYNSGKMGLAKSTYEIFCKEYKALLGENYKYSLLQVLETAKKN